MVRHSVLAVAIVLGAGTAFAYTASSQVNAAGRQPRTDIRTGTTTPSAEPEASGPATSTAPPPANLVLPFNAKLTSQDIPTPDGSVRDGGCSGSLIDPDWIITAGHCFHDVNDVRVGGPPRYHMTVTVGKTKDSDPGGQTVQVVDVRQSPFNDLALAKLSAPITGIAPLTLPDREPKVGLRMEFAGWGSTSATVVSSSDHLKRGEFTISKINATTIDAVPVVPRTVENSPCHDDSGSPYFVSTDDVHGELVAIEDSGPPCPQPGVESLARVDVVVSWIHQQLGDSGR